MKDTPQVTNNAAAEQFEVVIDGTTASLAYGRKGNELVLFHTEVPEALRGRGVASLLARGALTYAQEEGLAVVPFCPFMTKYLERHPEYLVLVPEGFR